MTVGDPSADGGRVTFVATEADLVAAYQCQYFARMWRRRTMIALAVFLAFAAVALYFAMDGNLAWVGATVVGAAIGGLTLPLMVGRLWVPIFARQIHRQQKSLHREVSLAWDVIGTDASTESGTSRTPWSDYLRWRENRGVILLYWSDALFQFIPKRALSSVELDSLRRLARAGMPAGAMPRSRP